MIYDLIICVLFLKVEKLSQIIVERIVNRLLKSNSFIVSFSGLNSAWVIDPGDSKPILKSLGRDKCLKGIFITHSHFDHIYGINDLIEVYPDVAIYSSDLAQKGMLSADLNSSCYTDNPFSVKCGNFKTIGDKDVMYLYDRIYATALYTPGHNHDCMSYEINEYLFTGDSLMQSIKWKPFSKNSSKDKACESIRMMIQNYHPNTIVCPGHGPIFNLGAYTESM